MMAKKYVQYKRQKPARSITCLLIGGMMMSACAREQEVPFSVEIDAKEIISKNFLGFGAEWDSAGYLGAGITKGDFDIIRTRVEWMRLPVARIMMLCKWCYKGNGKYDWASEEMKALYRHLDVCQTLGTIVFITDWGCEAGWLRCPDVDAVDDPMYAEIIGTYMEHLLNKKGYSCIKYFIMVNEPNYGVKNWDHWRRGIQNVHAEFQKRGLADKVLLAGVDHSNADDWHRKAVDQIRDILGAYDIHKYASDRDVRPGKLFDYFKKSWDYARQRDPKADSKPFVVGEAGLNDAAQHPRGNWNIDRVYYGVFMADYAIQAANAGSTAIIAWMLDDNSHPGFFWGMWANKEKGLKLRYWFYPWSLLSRCFPTKSWIMRTKPMFKDVRVLAACNVDKALPANRSWSFALVNRSDAPRTIRLLVKNGPHIEMSRYVYSMTSHRTDQKGFPAPSDRRVYDLGSGAVILCEPGSVVILTSIK